MNVIKKYWDSVYVYILLLVPALCMCAGIFWSIFKLLGQYPDLQWNQIIIFDCSQIVYLIVSLYFIYRNKKDSSYIYKKLFYVKGFIVFALFVQYNFILYLFASSHVWECTFLFFAIIVFLFDTKLTFINILSYGLSLAVAHIRKPELFLPMGQDNLTEIIMFRIIIFLLTSLCIMVIVYFAEHFLVQVRESNEENLHLIKKQLEYYRDMELLDTETRKFRHDINNHFVCMEHLLKNRKIDELGEYFETLQSTSSIQQKIYFSGNEIIDAILHYDLPRRCSEKVDVKIYGNLTEIKTVSSVDLCTIFSNLLSNAIKSANESCEERDGELHIRFSSGERYFSIEIINTVLATPGKKKKRNDKNHGYGINKIKEVLEEYDGKIESVIDGTRIKITVYLPI